MRSQPLTTADESRLESAVVKALYREHADELRAFLTGVLRNGDLAGEALQATFVKAMEVGHTAREETRKGWLFRVAFHEAMAIRRRDQRYHKSIRQLAWTQSSENELPEDQLARDETIDRVRAAMQTLPAEQLEVVRMRIYEEKTFAAIAEELSAPLGTVLTRMRLALRKLSGQLESKD